jgi:glycosyl transferase, family 25
MRQNIRTFVINLDRDRDRMVHMAKELEAAGLTFERFQAVYGLAVPESVAPFLLTADGTAASRLKPGEIGCYASHLALHQKIVADDTIEAALVLEDDVRLTPDFAALLQQLLQALPEGWDIVRLSNAPKKAWLARAPLVGGHELATYSRIPNNTGAYLISRKGAARFLAMSGPRHRAIDEDLRRPWFHGLSTWGVVPPPIVSNLFDSTIDALGDRGLRPGFNPGKLFAKAPEGPVTTFRRLFWTVRSLGLSGWLACSWRNLANLFKPKLSPNASDQERSRRFRVG